MRGVTVLLVWCMLIRSLEASSVRVLKSCFELTENIIVSFTVTNPKAGDWVGLIQSSASVGGGAANFPEFLFTCGTFSCDGARASGTLSFLNNLPAGFYKAVLVANGTSTPLAVSSNFAVRTTCPTPPPPPQKPSRLSPRPFSRPSPRPSTRPTPAPPPPGSLAAAKEALVKAAAQIQVKVQKNKFLLQQLLRLNFHDCHGICDGCVDMSNPDNGQIHFIIITLFPIVQQFANEQTGLSRSDIWVLAMIVALNNANQRSDNPVTFEMKWYGRVDCEKRNPKAVCTLANGTITPCGPLSGPKRVIAPVNLNSLGFADFWATNFKNITMRHAVALMGCHTVGRLFTQVSGIDGPSGWVLDNLSFSNEYFTALLGSRARRNMTVTELINLAPSWNRTTQVNVAPIPTRHFWMLKTAGRRLVMTNADVATVRLLDSSNTNSATGKVSCAFSAKTGQPVCPAASTIKYAIEFLDNDVWLKTVKEGLDLMTTNGYKRDSCPTGQLCKLGKLG